MTRQESFGAWQISLPFAIQCWTITTLKKTQVRCNLCGNIFENQKQIRMWNWSSRLPLLFHPVSCALPLPKLLFSFDVVSPSSIHSRSLSCVLFAFYFSFFNRSWAYQNERRVLMRKRHRTSDWIRHITLFCAVWFSVLTSECQTSFFYRIKFRRLRVQLLFMYRISALSWFSVSHLSKISTCQCPYWCFLNSGINALCRFSIFCIFLVFRISKFQCSRFLAKRKLRISNILHFNNFAVFGEFRKARGSKRIEKSWRTRKLRSVKKMCLCDGACLFLFSLQLVPLSFACSLSPASPFPLSCCSPLWPFSLSSSALFFLLSLRRDSRRPLAPLALNKENFAVVASRSMTKS